MSPEHPQRLCNPSSGLEGDPSFTTRRQGFAACRVRRFDSPRTRQDGGSLMKPLFAMMAPASALAASMALAQVPAQAPQGARPTNMAGGALRPTTTVPPLSPSTGPTSGGTSSIGGL